MEECLAKQGGSNGHTTQLINILYLNAWRQSLLILNFWAMVAISAPPREVI